MRCFMSNQAAITEDSNKDNVGAIMSSSCPICDSNKQSVFLSISQVPVHCNLICERHLDSLNTPKGDIDLTLCKDCGHVFNSTFDTNLMEYSGSYENSLHFSERFREYIDWLADQLIVRYALYDKKIAEVGCGQGDFLRLVCEKGGNTGIGFDPGYRPDEDSNSSSEEVMIFNEFYSGQLSDCQTDFLICRHVLEHIYDPQTFLNMFNEAVDQSTDATIFFEVPSLMWTLRDLSIWDIIYEHYSYFSYSSLSRLFIRCGLAVNAIYETYGKQFLCIEASKSKDQSIAVNSERDSINGLEKYVADFTKEFEKKIESSEKMLTDIEQAKKRVVLWGAGSKGVTFLNILNTSEKVKYVVDINPRKHGNYIAGTGQEIIPPEFLKSYKPDYIIVMNPIYLDEVREYANKKLGLSVELLTV